MWGFEIASLRRNDSICSRFSVSRDNCQLINWKNWEKLDQILIQLVIWKIGCNLLINGIEFMVMRYAEVSYNSITHNLRQQIW
ncbi:MAG: hypothetical protein F6K61_17480 [Sphaerospermopsis sp. SIO1G1]|nr:hypothetical protein [Sphaerospermopsis sp. SIO1G1]